MANFGEYWRFWRCSVRRLPERNKRKTREEIFSEPLQRQAEIHPEIRIARFQTELQAKLRCQGFCSYHSFENPSKLPSASRQIKHICGSNDPWQIFVCRPQTVTLTAHCLTWHCLTASNQNEAVSVTVWGQHTKICHGSLNYTSVLFGG